MTTKLKMENGPKWLHGQSCRAECQKNFGPAKPLISILDLGKLLLQYSRDGDVAKVHELIVKGAPFNADWLGMTPLHYAAKRDNYEICEMLLRGGINKDAKTKVDRTALHFAVYEGHSEIVKLFLSRNVDIDIKDMLRMTALHWAIEKRHEFIARLLIKHGADVSVLSKFHKSPITLAHQTKQTELIEELEKRRSNQRNKMLLNIQQSQSETNEAVNSITLNTLNAAKIDTAEEEYAYCERTKRDNSIKTNKATSLRQENVHFHLNSEDSDIQFDKLHLTECEQVEQSTLEMLKYHGITMLPQDDPKNLLTTVLEGGRKLILSEAGKLVLKDATHNISFNSKLPNNENLWRKISYSKFINARMQNKKVPLPLKMKTVTPIKNKNVKIISYDMFKRMYGSNVGNSFKKSIKSNMTPTSPTKVSKLIKLNNITNKKPVIQNFSEQMSKEHWEQTVNEKEMHSEYDDDLPPNIIEVCSESESDDNLTQEKMDTNPIPSNLSHLVSPKIVTNVPEGENSVPALDISEICRQLSSLQKQINNIQQQLAQTKKQNEDYRIRLESIERVTANINV